MSFFIPAMICIFGWGLADLFYKQSSEESDPYSHFKIAVWVGMVMGLCAFILLPSSENIRSIGQLGSNALRYLPASLCYIVSMVIGYAGLRYLELSIVSPVQNASGALSMLCMLIYFVLKGSLGGIREAFTALEMVGTLCIVAGMIALAVVEQRLKYSEEPDSDRKYRRGALALFFPLGYCLFDTLGTAADGIILDEETGLGLGEIDVIVLYGFTFLLAGIGVWLYLRFAKGIRYNPFRASEKSKAFAAAAEEFGQVFYVYAMARDPVLSAPFVASYCIVSVLLSRLILKERLKISQYLCIASVILGIVLMGIAEGLAS